MALHIAHRPACGHGESCFKDADAAHEVAEVRAERRSLAAHAEQRLARGLDLRFCLRDIKRERVRLTQQAKRADLRAIRACERARDRFEHLRCDIELRLRGDRGVAIRLRRAQNGDLRHCDLRGQFRQRSLQIEFQRIIVLQRLFGRNDQNLARSRSDGGLDFPLLDAISGHTEDFLLLRQIHAQFADRRAQDAQLHFGFRDHAARVDRRLQRVFGQNERLHRCGSLFRAPRDALLCARAKEARELRATRCCLCRVSRRRLQFERETLARHGHREP